MNKLLYVPLAVLCLLTLLSVTGLGTSNGGLFGAQSYTVNYDDEGLISYGDGSNSTFLYDETGHAVCDYNLTAVGEPGNIEISEHIHGDYTVWHNVTGSYYMFVDTEMQTPVNFADIQGSYDYSPEAGGGAGSYSYMLNSSLGFIAIIAVIMGIGVIAGIKIFGIGESEKSLTLLLLGSFYLAIWGALSLLSYPLLLEGGYYTFIPYFVLCLLYTLGIMGTVGDSNSD